MRDVPEAGRFDVAVVGGGPAGLAAATRAAETGARVVVLDESPNVGGQIWRHRAGTRPPRAARRWIDRCARSGAAHVAGATVFDATVASRRVDVADSHAARPADAPSHIELVAEREGRPLRIEARSVVLATGARELFLPFPGWTLPGVYGVGGAQALHKAGLSFAGKRVVIAGSGPLLLPVAASLASDGATVALVAEQAPLGALVRFATGLWRHPSAVLEGARYRAGFARTPYRAGWWVVEARGDATVREVVVTDGRERRTLACDALCTGFGLIPNTELAVLLGASLSGGDVVVDAHQTTTVPHVFSAGETTGVGGVDLALAEGEIAGLCAVGRHAEARAFFSRRDRLRAFAASLERTFAPRAELRSLATPSTIVCRCEDVPLGAISPAWSARQAKLYTRAGMGPCQGRVCGAALSFVCGFPPDSIRPPTASALLGTLTSRD